jgi:8-oxo-dGTP diphosphatase
MTNIVVAALLVQKNKLLICQRNLTRDFPGKWEFPGGKIEPGETPEEALQRELQEELGIAAEIGGEVWRVEHQYSGHAPVHVIFFAVSRFEGAIRNRVFQRVCWTAPPKLLQYDFLEADCILVERLATGEIVVPPC